MKRYVNCQRTDKKNKVSFKKTLFQAPKKITGHKSFRYDNSRLFKRSFLDKGDGDYILIDNRTTM